MLRQKWGSLVCPGCGTLVGVQDERCLNCGRWNPGMWGFGPTLTRLGRDMGFVPFVITSCSLLYVASMFAYRTNIGGLFDLFSPTTPSLFVFGASGRTPVFVFGRWWTVLTATWLHANILHIAMNMMSLRTVAPMVSEFYGASRMIIIYVVSGVAGFTVSTLCGQYLAFIPLISRGGISVGASASIAGLIGAVFFYGHRTGNTSASEQARIWIMMFLVVGFVFQNIDNWAHIGGLAGGYICAKILDPLYPERLDHFLIAVGSLALTGIALVFSIVQGILILR